MRQYETTFIVTPVLSDGEIKQAAESYISHIKKAGGEIVHVDEIGLKQLAYPIKKRNSGIYYSIEYKIETGEMIDNMELAFRRDERIMRFLTVRLDKYGIKYNEDKRSGIIGKRKKERADAKAKLEAEIAATKEAAKAAHAKKASDAKKKKLAEAEAAKAETVEVPAQIVETPAEPVVAKAETVEVPAQLVETAEKEPVAKAETVEVPAQITEPVKEEVVAKAETIEVPAQLTDTPAEKAVEAAKETIETVADTPDIAGEITLDDDILGDLSDLDKS